MIVKKLIQIVLIIILFSLSGYIVYSTVVPGCRSGVFYSLGPIPEEFNLSSELALKAAAEAAEIWNQRIGEDVITYDSESPFAINFIYDERQEKTNARLLSHDDLESSRSEIETSFNKVEKLQVNYNEALESYQRLRRQYRRDLEAYNKSVEEYNSNGRGSSDSISEQKAELESLYSRLEDAREDLNQLAAELNELANDANAQVDRFNNKVANFNQEFATSEDIFRQGVYNQYGIEVYQYETPSDLRALLVHEFGHALGMGHVSDEAAVMYYLQHEEQDNQVTITDADLVELQRVCETPVWKLLSLDNTVKWVKTRLGAE